MTEFIETMFEYFRRCVAFISKYTIVILELMTDFIKTMFEYFERSVLEGENLNAFVSAQSATLLTHC